MGVAGMMHRAYFYGRGTTISDRLAASSESRPTANDVQKAMDCLRLRGYEVTGWVKEKYEGRWCVLLKTKGDIE